MSAWPSVRISEIAARIVIGPFGSRMKADTYTATGVPVIRGTNLTDGKALGGDWVYVAEKTADDLLSCNVKAGDLVFPHRGAIGEVGLVPSGFDRYMLSTSPMMLRSSPAVANSEYLYYFFKSAAGRHELLKNASQVGTPGIGQPLTSLKSIEVPLPPLATQTAIVFVLRLLDDKIELNRRIGQTLKAIAHAIFKSWFVDFEPVHAKANGESAADIHKCLGLDPATQALFPATFSAQGPEGWWPFTLKDFTTKIGSGATPCGGREVYIDEGTALIRSQNVYDSQFVWDGLVRITDDAARQLANVMVQPGDVLLNITGASILRTCVVPPSVLPARVNQHVAIIRAKPGVPPHYLHQHLLLADTKAYLLGLNAGASREAVTKAHIESVPLLDPGPALLAAFETAVAPLFAQAQVCADEALALGELRDALLPKLLSGELSAGESMNQRSAMIV